MRRGDTLYAVAPAGHQWPCNLDGGAPVTVHVRDKILAGQGVVLSGAALQEVRVVFVFEGTSLAKALRGPRGGAIVMISDLHPSRAA